jgi:hypothetical protein
MHDLMNNVHPVRAVSPAAAIADNTAIVGQIVDRADYESVTYLLLFGADTDTDATMTTLLEHGDASDGSDMVAAPDTDLLGTEVLASANFADDNEPRKLGYVGGHRYTRMTVTPALNSGTVYLAIIALLGHPQQAPTPNPPI